MPQLLRLGMAFCRSHFVQLKTTNLRVGRSNRSGRANSPNKTIGYRGGEGRPRGPLPAP